MHNNLFLLEQVILDFAGTLNLTEVVLGRGRCETKLKLAFFFFFFSVQLANI